MNRRLLLILLILLAFQVAPRTQGQSRPGEQAVELVIPLRFHLLESKTEPQIHTTLTATNIQRILTKINGIWSQGGIRFTAESVLHEEVEPGRLENFLRQPHSPQRLLGLRPEPSRSSNVFHIYYVQTMRPNGIYLGEAIFVKQSASLRPVPGGIDEPLPRVTSHELGHALGLGHRQDVTNLMASGTTGTALSVEEIQTARETAQKLEWVKKVPRVNPR